MEQDIRPPSSAASPADSLPPPASLAEENARLQAALQQEFVERRRVEAALKLSEERFRLAVYHELITLFEQDLELRYTWLYPLHPEHGSAIGRTDLELLPDSDGVALTHAKREVIATGKSRRVEVRASLPDGIHYYDTFVSPRRSEAGTIIGVAGTALETTHHRRVQDARQRLAAIVESSGDAIISKDLNGIIASWNRGAERVFGYTEQEMIGKPIITLIPPNRISEESEILARVRRGERIEHYETVRRRKDGSLIQVSISVSPIFNDQGKIVGASKIARNITEQKRSEQNTRFLSALAGRLASVEDPVAITRFSSLLVCEHLGTNRCFFCEWDADTGRLVELNGWRSPDLAAPAHTPEVFEFGPPEWRQRLASGNVAVNDVDADPIFAGHLETYRKLQVRSFATTGFMRRQNRAITLAVGNSEPHTWRAEELALLENVLGRVWPLIERARTEMSLRRSERQLRLITDNAPVFLAQLDRDHRFKFVNQTYARRYQREVGKILGTHVRDLVGEAAYALFAPDIDRTFEGERVEFEQLVHYATLGPRWVHIVYTPEKTNDGQVVSVLALITDVTSRKETEQEIERARDQALAASRAKDDFLAALSHELRTPLNPVLLLASEAAESAALPEQVRADFATIRNNVELEARLIDDLLDLTRITRGKLSLEKRSVDAHKVLREAVSVVRPDLDQKNIRLTLNLDATRSHLEADPVRLEQVFWNLLKNAVKFTPANGAIEVKSENVGNPDRFRFTITDNGIGMIPSELNRVFEAFAQGEHASAVGSHRFGGIGLGLTISRMLVTLHDGEIRASSPGRNAGATFEIDFPLNAATAKSPGSTPPIAEGASGASASDPTIERKRVLLVEDHRATRDALAALLRRRNLEVITAASAEEAREVAKDGTLHFLISDIGLPDGSGNELMKEFSARYGMKGVALTGYGMDEDVTRSQTAGFAIHLTKPVTIQSLEKALAVLLGP